MEKNPGPVATVNAETQSKKSKFLTMIHVNTTSLYRHSDDLTSLVSAKHSHIIAISETWLVTNIEIHLAVRTAVCEHLAPWSHSYFLPSSTTFPIPTKLLVDLPKDVRHFTLLLPCSTVCPPIPLFIFLSVVLLPSSHYNTCSPSSSQLNIPPNRSSFGQSSTVAIPDTEYQGRQRIQHLLLTVSATFYK